MTLTRLVLLNPPCSQEPLNYAGRYNPTDSPAAMARWLEAKARAIETHMTILANAAQ